jgi:hypothetical protein
VPEVVQAVAQDQPQEELQEEPVELEVAQVVALVVPEVVQVAVQEVVAVAVEAAEEVVVNPDLCLPSSQFKNVQMCALVLKLHKRCALKVKFNINFISPKLRCGDKKYIQT